MRATFSNPLLLALVPATLLVAGCGGSFTLAGAGAGPLVLRSQVAAGQSSAAQSPVRVLAGHPVPLQTSAALAWTATSPDGLPAEVRWSVTGGDPRSGAGAITPEGVYTAPAWLSVDVATVTLHARLPGSDADAATATLQITPGFIRPLAPENLALAPGARATFSASIAEVGGADAIRFTLPTGDTGSLATPDCARSPIASDAPAYTVCSVSYTAPATPVAAALAIALQATVVTPADSLFSASPAGTAAVSTAALLLDPAGITSNPATHQQPLALPVQLGTSAGSSADYDAAHGQLTDCCGGTLGALVADASGNQYVLGNNHIFARSDQAIPGESILQPGLIDNGCTPYGEGPGTTLVASLVAYPLLDAPTTRADSALARVAPGTVDPTGAILELGPRQPDNTLAAAPPGVTSTAGRGEAARLGMAVAKSGRTTGLTCGAVTALDTEVLVDYYRDCAETEHAFRKRFTGQIVASGAGFADAGDSGSLVVDSADAEPVGLFFAGGTDDHGVEQAIANPVADVLGDLTRALAAGPLRFVGAADHPVACLRYPDPTVTRPTLPSAARAAAAHALELARQWAAANNPHLAAQPEIVTSADQVASDGSAEPAIRFSDAALVNLPRFFAGVPTQTAAVSTPQPTAAALARAERIRDSHAAALFALSSSIFGLGVGQSADNPADPALIVFVDRSQSAPALPISVDGERLRVIRMDRPHVTRGRGRAAVRGCRPPVAAQAQVRIPTEKPIATALPVLPLRLP